MIIKKDCPISWSEYYSEIPECIIRDFCGGKLTLDVVVPKMKQTVHITCKIRGYTREDFSLT
jgi:hypothetical protein